MKTLLLLPLLLMFVSPGQNSASSDASVAVLAFKWSKTHQAGKTPDPAQAAPATPAQEMLPINKNYQRQARMNDPRGARDPNEDTIDARSAAMEKIVVESRTPKGKSVDVFEYSVKVQNGSKKVIDVLFWEYQFREKANPSNVARRQFVELIEELSLQIEVLGDRFEHERRLTNCHGQICGALDPPPRGLRRSSGGQSLGAQLL